MAATNNAVDVGVLGLNSRVDATDRIRSRILENPCTMSTRASVKSHNPDHPIRNKLEKFIYQIGFSGKRARYILI